jgi:hypothetical protein
MDARKDVLFPVFQQLVLLNLWRLAVQEVLALD